MCVLSRVTARAEHPRHQVELCTIVWGLKEDIGAVGGFLYHFQIFETVLAIIRQNWQNLGGGDIHKSYS